MQQNNIDYNWLKPLITESINKSMMVGPEEAQTGPARRGDLETLDKHLELLNQNPSLAGIYKMISQHIIDQYQPD